MTTEDRESPQKGEPRATRVLAIHGIGPQEKGRIANSIRDAVGAPGSVDVHEYWWDAGDADELELGPLLYIGAHADIRTKGAGRLLVFLQDLTLLVIEVLVLALYAVVFVALPAVLLSELFDWPEDRRGVRPFAANVLLWVAVLLGAAAVHTVLLGLIRGLTMRRPGQVTSAIRRVLLVLLRPPLAAITHGAAIVLAVFVGLGEMLGCLALLMLALAALVVGTFLVAWIGGKLPTAEAVPFAGRALLAVVAITAAVGVGVVVITRGKLIWSAGVRLTADVFRYAVSHEFREALLEQLEEEAQNLHDRGQLVIVAHSLGSVIAVDSLLTSDTWRRFDRVVLITMGSPIRRFFCRFFPGMVIPATVRSAASDLEARYPSFHWINIYRPLDYVGGRLSGGEAVDDRSTGQGRRFHLGYWDDEAVVRAAITAIQEGRAERAGGAGDVGSTTWCRPTTSFLPEPRRWLARASIVIPPILTVVAAGWVVFASGPDDEPYDGWTSDTADLEVDKVTKRIHVPESPSKEVTTWRYRFTVRGLEGPVEFPSSDDVFFPWRAFESVRFNEVLRQIQSDGDDDLTGTYPGMPILRSGVRPDRFVLELAPPRPRIAARNTLAIGLLLIGGAWLLFARLLVVDVLFGSVRRSRPGAGTEDKASDP